MYYSYIYIKNIIYFITTFNARIQVIIFIL